MSDSTNWIEEGEEWLNLIEPLFEYSKKYPKHFMFKGGMYRLNAPGDISILESGNQTDLDEFIERCKDVIKNNS